MSSSTRDELTEILDPWYRDHTTPFDYDCLKRYIVQRVKVLPKILIDNYCVQIELEDDDNMEFFMQKAKEELRETPEVVAQGLKELRELVAGEPDMVVINHDAFYTIFLRPCKWYAQSAFSLMKRFFRFQRHYSHVCTNLLPSNEKRAFYASVVYPMPLRNKDGSRIVLVDIGKRWKPKEISLEEIFKSLMLCTQVAMYEPKSQISGVCCIIDCEGFSLSHATYFSPSFAKMMVEYIQKAVPLRIKSVHIVNQPVIFNMVFALFKPFLEEKIRKRIHFHGTNRESLMTFFDDSVLLKRQGGQLDVIDSSFGINLWTLLCEFDVIFEVYTKLGYQKKK